MLWTWPVHIIHMYIFANVYGTAVSRFLWYMMFNNNPMGFGHWHFKTRKTSCYMLNVSCYKEKNRLEQHDAVFDWMRFFAFTGCSRYSFKNLLVSLLFWAVSDCAAHQSWIQFSMYQSYSTNQIFFLFINLLPSPAPL